MFALRTSKAMPFDDFNLCAIKVGTSPVMPKILREKRNKKEIALQRFWNIWLKGLRYIMRERPPMVTQKFPKNFGAIKSLKIFKKKEVASKKSC